MINQIIRNNSNHRYKAIFLGVTLVSFLTIFSNTAHATTSLNLTVSSDTVKLNIASTRPTGTFAKSDNVNISASTNNQTGYTLSIAGSSSSDNNKLINSTSSSNYLTSVSEPTTEEAFSSLTGTAYNNKWGYLPSKYCTDPATSTCSTNTSFLPAPPSTGDILDVTDSANSTANEYTLAIGARVDSTTKVGSYTNTYNVILVANAIPYTITYDDSIISNMPTDVDSTSMSSTVNIASNVPVRSGYKFLGWCTVMPTGTGNNLDQCSGTQYSPSQAWTLDGSTTNNLHLYAMWKEVTYLQNLDASKCTTTAITATDARDGEEYKIQRLADGKCWMLDNLRLDLTNSTILNGLTTSNTHVNDASLTSLKSGNRSAGNQYASSGFVAWVQGDTNNVYNQAKANADYKDNVAPVTYGSGSGKNGVYYNYCAASAGSYCYDSGSGTGNASYDLCPAGWRMPTSSSSGEYQALYAAYSSDATSFRNALSTPLSGNFNNGSASNQGSSGSFWSSTYRNGNLMYFLYVSSSNVYPVIDDYRNYGNSLRCLLGS